MTSKIFEIDQLNEKLWCTRFDDSVKISVEALKNLKRAEKSNYHKGMAYAGLTAAAGYFLQSKNELSLKYLSESYQWFEANKEEKGFVRALLLKGNIFESFGDYEKTLSLWLEALKASTEINDKESEGEASSQLGLIYSRLCNHKKALEFFNKGLMIRESLGDENAVASSLNRIGMVLRQMKKYDEALGYYFKSLEIRKKNKQLHAIPWTLLGIGNTYEEMKSPDDALSFYLKGINGADDRCKMQCMLGAGRIYSHLGNHKKAEEMLEKSLKMASELNSMVLVADAYSALADHYEVSGKPDKALQNFKQYLSARDKFHSSETQSRLSNIEIAHAIEKSEQEKEIFRLKHVELKKAYDIIEEKNHDITASINYASRIQRAILPEPGEIRGLTSRLFIVYFPKDIVSGDFYWFTRIKNKLIIVAADCTGHGVPGALMSMLGVSFLEEIVNFRKITESGKILDELRNEIQNALKQKGRRSESKDGMDIALCTIDRSENSIQYSGAYNNLYLIRKGELIEYPADKMPIGIYEKSDISFKTNTIESMPGDMLYMYSDGYADQFGGPEGKKFKYSRLKETLLSIHNMPLKAQKKILEKTFLDWKGNDPQIDDVMILGYRI